MEHSGIQGFPKAAPHVPDSATLHPGYLLRNGQNTQDNMTSLEPKCCYEIAVSAEVFGVGVADNGLVETPRNPL
ncbi:hypothetical protein JCM17961_10610 [Endothiovibrio diazotrophicus]